MNYKYGDNAKNLGTYKNIFVSSGTLLKMCYCVMKLKQMLLGVMLFKHAVQLHGVQWDERMIMNPKLDNWSWFMENTMIIAHSSCEIKERNQWEKGRK